MIPKRSSRFSAEQRTVSNDHCISFDGVVYEVPVGLAGQRITILRALLEDDALYLNHRGRRIRLHPVDLTPRQGGGTGPFITTLVDDVDRRPMTESILTAAWRGCAG